MKPYKPETLGLMIDMSRNAVMNPETLKKTYMPLMKKMGYNCLMLYTEDTYEVEGEPYFGYMRGRYTMAELRDLDECAASLGIELIPCIQTLAHLDAFVRWKKVKFDVDNILLAEDERSYEFIENLIRSVRKCFRTNRIHIGMDEAWMLGRGNYLEAHGYTPKPEIMNRHLARVNEIVKKYGYEPMIWSDMFFRAFSPTNQYYFPKIEMPEQAKEGLPENVIPIYWDYYHMKESEYDDMLCNHEQISDKTWFAGGIWTWSGFLPRLTYSLESMRPAVDACRKHNVKGVIFTLWGDNGGECSRYSPLPDIYYLAQYARGNTDDEKIKKGFEKLIGIPFDDFMAMDKVVNGFKGYHEHGGAPKMALYNDYFNGVRDALLLPEYPETVRETAKKLHEIARSSRKWGYLFDSAAKLCDVIELKYDLGGRTRAAYKAGDKEELRRLATEVYPEVAHRVAVFAKAFEKQWYKENKTTGFDVQEIRLGGLIYRTDSCRRRLLDYVNGRIDRIEELDIDFIQLDDTYRNDSYAIAATPNRI